MPTIAYLANQFPSPLEHYVVDEIQALRRRGVHLVLCSARKPCDRLPPELKILARETLYLESLNPMLLLASVVMFFVKLGDLSDLLARVLFEGRESLSRRCMALLHTFLGVYLALCLRNRSVEHIHVHHGFFSSWIAMVAARLLGIPFSMTLHGSDLLLHAAYLDAKLTNCASCFTISQFNRDFIHTNYPEVDRSKILLRRMGVPTASAQATRRPSHNTRLRILCVGRLHPVKDHAFLLHALHQAKQHGLRFECLIAGNGPEHSNLENMISDLDLDPDVKLLGHRPRRMMDHHYSCADLVVLTSRSEGIPLVLMEAMAHGVIVLAPNITGIPELVLDGETGFLYRAGSGEHFVERLDFIADNKSALSNVRHAAREHVIEHFDLNKNLELFTDIFLSRIDAIPKGPQNENPLLQQIQLPLQRDRSIPIRNHGPDARTGA